MAVLGIGDRQGPVPDSSSRHAATRANRGTAAHSVWEKGQGTASTGQHSNIPQCQNTWAHAPPPQCLHFCLPLRTPHSNQLASAGLLGDNPNTRLAPKGPFLRGLMPQCWGFGTTKPQCQTHPVARPKLRPIKALRLIQDGRKGRALQAPGEY